jgi:hypothetical protein
VTGLINQELLLKNEYMATENRILRAHLPARLRLSNHERSTLAEIGLMIGSDSGPFAMPIARLSYSPFIRHTLDCPVDFR